MGHPWFVLLSEFSRQISGAALGTTVLRFAAGVRDARRLLLLLLRIERMFCVFEELVLEFQAFIVGFDGPDGIGNLA